MIAGKIDVTKIAKEKLFQGKNGAKYLDIVLIETKNSKYGDDYLIVQGATKEERAAGQRGAILGNAKIIRSSQQSAPSTSQDDTASDDVPF